MELAVLAPKAVPLDQGAFQKLLEELIALRPPPTEILRQIEELGPAQNRELAIQVVQNLIVSDRFGKALATAEMAGLKVEALELPPELSAKAAQAYVNLMKSGRAWEGYDFSPEFHTLRRLGIDNRDLEGLVNRDLLKCLRELPSALRELKERVDLSLFHFASSRPLNLWSSLSADESGLVRETARRLLLEPSSPNIAKLEPGAPPRILAVSLLDAYLPMLEQDGLLFSGDPPRLAQAVVSLLPDAIYAGKSRLADLILRHHPEASPLSDADCLKDAERSASMLLRHYGNFESFNLLTRALGNNELTSSSLHNALSYELVKGRTDLFDKVQRSYSRPEFEAVLRRLISERMNNIPPREVQLLAEHCPAARPLVIEELRARLREDLWPYRAANFIEQVTILIPYLVDAAKDPQSRENALKCFRLALDPDPGRRWTSEEKQMHRRLMVSGVAQLAPHLGISAAELSAGGNLDDFRENQLRNDLMLVFTGPDESVTVAEIVNFWGNTGQGHSEFLCEGMVARSRWRGPRETEHLSIQLGIGDTERQGLLREVLAEAFRHQHSFDELPEICALPCFIPLLNDPQVAAAAGERILRELPSRPAEIAERVPLLGQSLVGIRGLPGFQAIMGKALGSALVSGGPEDAKRIAQAWDFGLNEFKDSIDATVSFMIVNNEISLRQFAAQLSLDSERCEAIAGRALSNQLDSAQVAAWLRREQARDYQTSRMPVRFAEVSARFGLRTLGELSDFFCSERELLQLAQDEQGVLELSEGSIKIARALRLRMHEAERLLRGGVDLQTIRRNEDYSGLYLELRRCDPVWSSLADDRSGRIQHGLDKLGLERFLSFAGRTGLSRHDSMHAFAALIGLWQNLAPELPAAEFDRRMLRQIRNDGRTYPSGSAHHHATAIALRLNTNFFSTIASAREFEDIKGIRAFLEIFSKPEDVLGSWANLRRWAEFQDQIQRSRSLIELRELRRTGRHNALCDFIEALAFSESGVDMAAALELGLKPGTFIAREDSHSRGDLHARKKPSNYVEIPHLDLDAENLRDALVTGALDRIQIFPPMVVRYRFGTDGRPLPFETPRAETVSEIRRALGDSKTGLSGESRSRRKLFHALNQCLRPHGLDVRALLAGRELPPGALEPIRERLYSPEIGIAEPIRGELEIVARVNLKSDPEAAIAGNRTACCMPFGSGKNNVYIFNLNCALFTIELLEPSGRSKTIAQSVLTADKDIGIKVSDVLGKIDHPAELEALLPKDFLRQGKRYLACDNIETNRNFAASAEGQKIIERVYHDFFRRYLAKHGVNLDLDGKLVPIGMGYTDALTSLPTVENTFLPLAPVAYSDKVGPRAYALSLQSGEPLDGFEPELAPFRPGAGAPLTAGISPLTFQDTLEIAYLESSAYRSNPTLRQYFHDLENALMAKDIANAFHGRPNLSLKYSSSKGEVRAYILAHEGRYDSGCGMAPGLSEGTPIIYVTDLATEPGARLAGGKLLSAFCRRVAECYASGPEIPKIYAEFRESSSYPLIVRHFEELARKHGCEAKLSEGRAIMRGTDKMIPMLIELRRIPVQGAAAQAWPPPSLSDGRKVN